MVARYSDGETLDAIGQTFGISRERVRQIIAKVGGTNAEESRRKRMETRDAAIEATRESFMKTFGVLCRDMARQGVTRADAVVRLKYLYPSVDIDIAEDALKSSSIVFDKSHPEDIFSNEVLTAGVWFLTGSELRLGPDLPWSAVNLDLSLINDLQSILEVTSATASDLSTILGVIGAAQKHLRDNPTASITGARYDQLRDELVDALGLVSKQGAAPWPPTRQTVMKRFGGWNEALGAMGIGTTTRGRPKGLLKFTQEEYDDAVSDFSAFSKTNGIKATFAAYDEWVKLELGKGMTRPSGASVRNVYGTWADALRSVDA